MGRLAVRAQEDILQNGPTERRLLRVETELIDRGSVAVNVAPGGRAATSRTEERT